MLHAKNLAAIRGDRVLYSSLDFSLQQGDLLYVNGPNGSGKTTLLRMLCGLVVPAEGNILWNEESISKSREDYLANLLYIGHQAALKDDLTALENLKILNMLAEGSSPDDGQLTVSLARMGLSGCEELPVKVLSQGQKRRVIMARLLLSQAGLWILDEPYAALDTAAVSLMQGIINEHLNRKGMVVLTTHQEVEIDTPAVKHIHMGA